MQANINWSKKKIRAPTECMKEKRRARKNRDTNRVNAHQQKIDQHRHRRVCIYCSRYMCLVHIWKHDWGFFLSLFFLLPPKWMCVFCVLVVVLFFWFIFSHSLSHTAAEKKTHKTPFTSHIKCIKTAFLCIKMSDSHCECMTIGHKQYTQKQQQRAVLFCFALWHSVGVGRPS